MSGTKRVVKRRKADGELINKGESERENDGEWRWWSGYELESMKTAKSKASGSGKGKIIRGKWAKVEIFRMGKRITIDGGKLMRLAEVEWGGARARERHGALIRTRLDRLLWRNVRERWSRWMIRISSEAFIHWEMEDNYGKCMRRVNKDVSFERVILTWWCG